MDPARVVALNNGVTAQGFRIIFTNNGTVFRANNCRDMVNGIWVRDDMSLQNSAWVARGTFIILNYTYSQLVIFMDTLLTYIYTKEVKKNIYVKRMRWLPITVCVKSYF